MADVKAQALCWLQVRCTENRAASCQGRAWAALVPVFGTSWRELEENVRKYNARSAFNSGWHHLLGSN